MAGTKGLTRRAGPLIAPAGRVGVIGEKSRRSFVRHGSVRWDDRRVYAMVSGTVAATVRALRFDLGTHGSISGICEGADRRCRAGSPSMDTPGVKPLIQTSCSASAVRCRAHHHVPLRGLSAAFRRHPLTTYHTRYAAGATHGGIELFAGVLLRRTLWGHVAATLRLRVATLRCWRW